MMHSILLLQQRKGVAACRETFAGESCVGWGVCEGSGPAQASCTRACASGSSVLLAPRKGLNFSKCCAFALWPLPPSTPSPQAPAISLENRNWKFRSLKLSSSGAVGTAAEWALPKHFAKTLYPHSPSYVLTIEPSLAKKNRS